MRKRRRPTVGDADILKALKTHDVTELAIMQCLRNGVNEQHPKFVYEAMKRSKRIRTFLLKRFGSFEKIEELIEKYYGQR